MYARLAALRQHVTGNGLTEKKDGASVDADAFIEALRFHIEEIAPLVRGNASIVHQAINSSPAGDRRVQHCRMSLKLCHIGKDR